MDKKKYEKGTSENGLINVRDFGASSRTKSIKDSLTNEALFAYLDCKKLYGTNAPVDSLDIIKIVGHGATLRQNFCGVVVGLLSHVEQLVTSRVAEAVAQVQGKSLDDALFACFRSLLFPFSSSQDNRKRNSKIDMQIKTLFCTEAFTKRFWKILAEPLFPAIDSYLERNVDYLGEVQENEKEYVYSLFVAILQTTIEQAVKENPSEYTGISERREFATRLVRMFTGQFYGAVRGLALKDRSNSDFCKTIKKSA